MSFIILTLMFLLEKRPNHGLIYNKSNYSIIMRIYKCIPEAIYIFVNALIDNLYDVHKNTRTCVYMCSVSRHCR